MPDRVPTSRLLPTLAAVAVAAALGLSAAALAGRTGTGTAGDTGSAPAPASTPASTPAGTPPAAVGGDRVRTAPRLAFLGDSLTVGVGAPAGRGYAGQVAEQLGWPVVLVDGVSGSGFLAAGGGRPMTDRVADVVAADPDVVVVAGGTNDVGAGYPPDRVGRAAAEVLTELRAGLPEAEVLVVGPLPTSFDAIDDPDPVRDAVRAAVEAAGAHHLDVTAVVRAAVRDAEEWDRYISADGFHPNELGYAVLADAVVAELDALVG